MGKRDRGSVGRGGGWGGERGIRREDIRRRGEEGRERGRESVCDCIVCRYGHEWVYKHTTNS